MRAISRDVSGIRFGFMFGDQAFHTWAVILVGAVLFSALFVLLAMMMELVFEGAFQMTPGAVGFGVVAFVGYVGTAMLLRRGRAPRDD